MIRLFDSETNKEIIVKEVQETETATGAVAYGVIALVVLYKAAKILLPFLLL